MYAIFDKIDFIIMYSAFETLKKQFHLQSTKIFRAKKIMEWNGI